MVDFNKLHKKYNRANKSINGQEGGNSSDYNPDLAMDGNGQVDPDAAMEQMLIEARERGNKMNQPDDDFDLATVAAAGDPMTSSRMMDEQLSDIRGGKLGRNVRNAEDSWSHSTWRADEVYQDYISQIGENIAFGTGQLIGQYGDLFHALDSMITGGRDGNILSRFLQDIGQDVMDSNESYIPPELADPSFSIETFTNPRFWTVHGARFVPQLVEILATGVAAGGVRKLAQKGLTKALDKSLKEGSEAMFKKGFVGSTGKQLARKGDDAIEGFVQHESQKGKLFNWKKFITDEGKMTKSLSDMVENASAGALTNIRVGLSNAGELHMSLKDLKDQNGNQLYTDEELGAIAGDAFANNLAYIGLDIASWSVSFGKGRVGEMGLGKSVRKTFDKAQQTKYVGGLVGKTGSNILKGVGKLAGKGTMEGMEETIQESWEEYSKLKAIHDNYGDLKTYADGKYAKLMEDDDKGGSMYNAIVNGDFMEFYLSKENEGTRAIAFGLGAMAGGAFNVRQAFNNNANNMHKIRTRSENLKAVIKGDNSDKELQRADIMNQITEIVHEDKGHLFAPFMKQMLDNGVITDEDFEVYDQAYRQIQEENEKVKDLDIKGKGALLQAKISSKLVDGYIKKKEEELQKNINAVAEMFGYGTSNFDKDAYERRVKELAEGYQEELTSLHAAKDQHDENAKAILSGKAAKRNAWRSRWDEDKQKYVFEKVKNGDDADERNPHNGEEDEEKETSFSENVKQKAKKAVSSITNLFNPKRSVTGGPNNSEIEISDIRDSNAYSQEDLVELEKEMEAANMTKDELSELAKKHGVEVSEAATSGGFIGESKSAVANAISEKNQIENDRKNKIEKEFLEKRIADRDAKSKELDDKIKGIDDEVKTLRQGEDIKSKLNSPFAKKFMEDNPDATISDVENAMFDEIDKLDSEMDELLDKYEGTEEYPTEEEAEAWTKKSEEAQALSEDVKTVSTNENLKKERELLKEKAKLVKEQMSQTGQKRSRRYEERLGLLNGVPIEEQIKARKAERKAARDKAREEAKAKAKKEGKKYTDIRAELKNALKSAIKSGQDLTEETRSAIINKLEESGVITSRNKGFITKWIDDLFLEEKAKNRTKKTRSTMRDSERMSAPTTTEDIFSKISEKVDKAAKKIKGKNVRARVSDNSTEAKNPTKVKRSAGKPGAVKMLRDVARNMNEASRSIKNKATRTTARPLYSADARTTAQMWTVNKKLETMFPDANVTALNVENLYATLGYDVLGLAINSTIFIDSSQWNQGNNKTYMHELGHIFFNLSHGEEETKKLVESFLKNKSLLDKIKREYWDQEVIIDTRTGERILISDLQAFDPENPVEFQKKVEQDVKNGHLERVPDHEQSIWIDEMFAYNMEGPLSQEFNMYFEPKNEVQRQGRLKKWWGWLKNRGKKAGVLDIVKTHEEKTRKQLSNSETEAYLDVMENTLDKFTQSIKGKPVLGRLRFRKEIDEALIYGEEFAQIGAKLDAEKDYVRSNEFSKSNVSKDRRIVLDKDEIREFRETGWPSQKAIHLIANKLYKYAVNTNKIDTTHLQGIEKEIYATVSDEIDNIVNEELALNEINSVLTTQEDQDFEDDAEMYDFFESETVALHENREKYSSKYQKFIASFIDYYNIFNKEKALLLDDFDNMIIADKDDILDFIVDIAENSNNPVEFIYQMQNAEHPIVRRFMSYLEHFRPHDSHTFMKGMYVVMSNMTETVPISKHVKNSNGKMEISNALSKREISRVQGVYENIKKTFTTRGGKDKTPKPYIDGKFMTNLNNSIESIRANDFTRGDLKRVLQFFSSYNVDVDKLIDQGYLIMDGKSYDIKLLTRQFLMSNNAFGENKTYDVVNGKRVSRNINSFLRAIEATNRIYKARQTVLDANGNQVQSTYVNNALLRLSKQMERDARKMTLSQFLKKYNFGNKSANVAQSNVVLKKMHERVQQGGTIDLRPSTGTSNTMTNTNNVVKEMTNEEKSFDNFLTFMAKPFKSTTYSMDIGRLADSSRAYNLEVPFLDVRKWSNYDESTGTFDENSAIIPNELSNAFKAYKKLLSRNNPEAKGYKIQQFIKGLNNAVDEEIEFLRYIHQNSLNPNKQSSKYSDLNKVFNPNGSLTKNGRMIVAQYVANDVVNVISTQQILFPNFGYTGNDLLKRSKSMASPSFTLGKHVKIETIYFPDIIDDSITVDGKPLKIGDAASFILQEDAQRMRDYYGGQMKIGHGLKILNSGIEMENEYFKNENVYDKGFTIELSEEFVQQNPQLRPLYELMKARRAKHMEHFGKPASLDKGIESQIIHAVPLSARKLKNPTKKRKVTYTNRAGQEVTSEVNFEELNFSHLIDPATGKPFPNQAKLYNEYLNKANAFLDSVYYSLEENADEGTSDIVFNGQSGENFGVQQVMDIPKYDAMMSVQMMNFITTNVLVDMTNKEANAILEGIAELQQNSIGDLLEMINNNNSEELREFLLANIDTINVDQTQLASIRTDNLSLATPWVRTLTLNTISNILRKKGNKIKTDGTVARQIPDFYHNKWTGETSLKSTKRTSDGVQIGEAVMPKHMKGKVNSRRYFSFADKDQMNDSDRRFVEKVELEVQDKQLNETQAVELLMDKINKRFNKNKKRKIRPLVKNGKMVGAYIEGDQIITTRIPAHGPQSTTVLEVVDFGAGDGFNVQLPKEFAMVNSGGDFDGDQVFIQHANNDENPSDDKKKWNSVFSKMTKYFTSPNWVEESDKAIEFKDVADYASDRIKQVYGNPEANESLKTSPKGLRNDHVNTAESKGLIGIAASMHSILSLFSNYNTEVTTDISIDGDKASNFTDNHDAESRVLNSARLFNIILDNTKNGYADILNLNMQTISTAMTLVNLGYGLDQVGVILNSDIAKKWAQQKGSYNNMYLNNDYQAVQVLDKNGEVVKPQELGTVVTTGKNVKSLQNQANILELLNNVQKINDDVQVVNKILSGHNKLERNPFESEEQIKKFEDIINNDTGSGIRLNQNFANNPRIKNYLKNAKTHLNLLKKLDPTYREAGKNVYQKMTNNPIRNTTNQEKTKIKNDTNRIFDSIIFGLNNYTSKEVKDIMDSVISDVLQYKTMLEEDSRLVRDPKNAYDVDAIKTSKQESLLFSKVLMIKSIGQNKDIGLNAEFFQNGFSESSRQRAMEEFAALPVELQEKILLYDFLKTGWANPNSIIKIAPMSVQNKISKAAENDLNNKKNNNISDHPDIHRAVLANNIETIPFITRPLVSVDENNVETANKRALTSKVKSALTNYSPFTVRYKDANNNTVVFEFNGFDRNAKAKIINIKHPNDKLNAMLGYMLENYQTHVFTDNDLKNPERFFLTATDHNYENVLTSGYNETSPSGGSNNTSNTSTQKKKSIGGSKPKSKYVRAKSISIDENYMRFTDKLDFDHFESVVNRDKFLTTNKLKSLYEKYKQEYDIAKNIADKLSKKKLATMSGHELMDIYNHHARKDKLSQAVVLRPVIMELIRRITAEQVNLIKSNNPDKEYNPNESKDLNLIQKYMIANNIPSDHPAAQAMVRHLEVEYKKFLAERNRLMNDLNNATDKLYQAKRGYSVNSDTFLGKIKGQVSYLFDQIFRNPEKINESLYGNLITFENFIDDSGRERRRMKYKSKSEIESLYKDKQITKAEYDFYNTSTRIMQELAPYNAYNKQSDYIPHTAPSLFEKFARRGLLGVIADSKSPNDKIKDVVFKEFVDPITGEVIENVTFKKINEFILEAGKTSDKNKLQYAKVFAKYKLKAIELGNKGINEDGTPIEYSDVHIQTVMGDFKLNDFSNERGVDAEMFPSMDLNKAFSDYINSSLITNGNKNFGGLKQLYPIIDGVINLAEMNGNPNLKDYVQTIWKDYFIKNKRKELLPNNKYFELLNTSPDAIVRFGLRSSMLYWLGIKGLLGTGGLYAVGNVLAGKYFNIKNQGGKAWAKGEKRFWMGSKGISITDPFRGVKESVRILNQIGYMDVNIYDDVPIYKKNDLNNFITELALTPMIWSEKWIQGVNFLGMLTDEEYEHIANGGRLNPERMAELEDTVKKNHGKGYQPTDQRMIQMFSFGQVMLQFSRHIPTIFHDSFAKRDFNIYGKEDEGSYRALTKVLMEYISGFKSQKDFIKYFNELDETERQRTLSALRGLGMLSLAWAGSEFAGMKSADRLIHDVNAPMDLDKLSWKIGSPPLVAMIGERFK